MLYLHIGVERKVVNVLLPELVKCQAQAAHAGRASLVPLPPLFALTTGSGRQEKGKGKD